MEKDFAKISLNINEQIYKLLEIYKTDFMADFNNIASNKESISSILETFPGLDILIEFLQKISIIFSGSQSNCLLEVQQKFLQEHLQIYSEIINNKKNINNNYLYLKNVYILFKKYWFKLLDLVDFEQNKKNKLIFYFNNILESNEPQNFLNINPEIIYSTVEHAGKNLFIAVEKILTDLIKNKGYFQIKTTDFSKFTVGKNLAITPGKVVFKNDLIELIKYTPTTKTVYQAPLLLIPPFINKYYILDLSANNSLVKWLVSQGIVVYIISWINPGSWLANKQFADYVLEGPLKAIDIITKINLYPKVHLAGYCIGGTLLSCTLSYMQKLNDNRALSATHFMSLVDFSNLGNIGALINKSSLNLLENLVNNKGYLDGRLLSMAFNLLRPGDLIWPNIINNYILNKPLKALDILYWNADTTNLPSNMYMFYLRYMCLENKLKESNAIKLNEISIDLKSIKVPTFCLAGDTDHITVWQSAYNSAKLYGGPVEFVLSRSGHIKGMINPPIDNKYSFKINKANLNIKLNPKLTHVQWLENAEEHPGSWWPYWLNWLNKINSEKIKTRDLYNTKNLKMLASKPNAPGNYVLQKV